MKTRLSTILAWVLAAAVIISFFLPWARLSFKPVSNMGEMTQMLVKDESWGESYLWMRDDEWKELREKPAEGLSAYQLLMNQGERVSDRIAHAFAVMLWGEGKADWKMWVLILAPIWALGGAILLTCGRAPAKWLALAITAQAGLYFYLRWKMNETYADRLLWQVELNLGLWITLYGLLALSLLELLRLLTPKSKW